MDVTNDVIEEACSELQYALQSMLSAPSDENYDKVVFHIRSISHIADEIEI